MKRECHSGVKLGARTATSASSGGLNGVYDTRRDLVWAIGAYNLNDVRKIDPATLDIASSPAIGQ